MSLNPLLKSKTKGNAVEGPVERKVKEAGKVGNTGSFPSTVAQPSGGLVKQTSGTYQKGRSEPMGSVARPSFHRFPTKCQLHLEQNGDMSQKATSMGFHHVWVKPFNNRHEKGGERSLSGVNDCWRGSYSPPLGRFTPASFS